MAEHLAIHSFIPTMHLCGGTGLLSTRILQGEKQRFGFLLIASISATPYLNLSPFHISIYKEQNMQYQHSPCLDGVQIQFCLMGDKIKTLMFSLKFMFTWFPKKMPRTLHEYLAGVNSQGGSIVTGGDVENHSDPRLHKSLGKESRGELKDLFL